MEVKINGERYVPISEVPLRVRSGKHPSDICRRCGEENFHTTDSRNKDGYRVRSKKCLSCGYRWKTIEYMYLPQGRPKNLESEDFEE